jgi:hypothetical protein
MPDLILTRAQLQAEFADNNTGNITAQFGRNLVVSAFGFAGTGPPSPNNDVNDTAGLGAKFDTGSTWIDVSAKQVWQCVQGTVGSALWVNLTAKSTPGMSTINRSAAPVQNTAGVMTPLWSFNVPNTALLANLDELRFSCYGTLFGNTDLKQFQVVFGGTTLAVMAVNLASATKWIITGRIIRTGNNVQQMVAQITYADINIQQSGLHLASPTEVLPGVIPFSVKGQAPVAGEIAFSYGAMEYCPA